VFFRSNAAMSGELSAMSLGRAVARIGNV